MDFMQEYAEFVKRALSFSSAELRDLNDEELGDVLRARVFHVLENRYEYDYVQAVSDMSEAMRCALILYTLNDEIQNGGLCQYFVNSTSDMAPYAAEALTAVGASGYAALFTSFCAENGIDLTNLSSFKIDNLDDDEYEAQTECYPFADFDDAYYELYEDQPLEELIGAYARKHLDEF